MAQTEFVNLLARGVLLVPRSVDEERNTRNAMSTLLTRALLSAPEQSAWRTCIMLLRRCSRCRWLYAMQTRSLATCRPSTKVFLRFQGNKGRSVTRRGAQTGQEAKIVPKGFKLLSYEFVPDYEQRRAPYRAQHLADAASKATEGKLILAGAMGYKLEGALLIWKDTTEEEIRGFAENDIYVTSGLVASYGIKPFHVVVEA